MPNTDPKLSEARLWSLVEERSLAGADHKRIDQRLWDLYGEEWAVLVTDLAGFARQTAAFGIVHFLRVLHEKRQLLTPLVIDHDGVLLRVEGDSLFVAFRRPERALRCAVEMQRAAKKANERRSPEEQFLLCVGLGYGRVLRAGDREMWGVEASAAQLLAQGTAEAHQILVTKQLHDSVQSPGGVPEGIEFLDLALSVAGSAQNYRLKF